MLSKGILHFAGRVYNLGKLHYYNTLRKEVSQWLQDYVKEQLSH